MLMGLAATRSSSASFPVRRACAELLFLSRVKVLASFILELALYDNGLVAACHPLKVVMGVHM